jgi:hypothetical protein
LPTIKSIQLNAAYISISNDYAITDNFTQLGYDFAFEIPHSEKIEDYITKVMNCKSELLL